MIRPPQPRGILPIFPTEQKNKLGTPYPRYHRYYRYQGLYRDFLVTK
jgi:hypothetical protein